MKRSLRQLQDVDDLALLLELAGLSLDADDIADVVWLAQFIQPTAPAAGPTDEEDAEVEGQDTEVIERRVDTRNEAAIPISTAPAASPAAETETTDGSPAGMPIQIPAAPALRHRRELAKALRPLMRKVPSRTATVFDAAATTEQIAEQGIWSAVMTPAPERWFDLVIVVEQSRSTPIWRDTLAELKLLAERQGAFRRVSTWQIQLNGTQLLLQPRWHDDDLPLRSCNHKTLIDPAGRRLIWLVSDCTSALWQQAQIYEWLRDWGKQCPTTIVQLFPGRLWPRTALGEGIPVRLSAFTPGVPNAQLQVEEALPFSDMLQWIEPADDDGLEKFRQPALATVPVVSLEAYPLQEWARVINGRGESETPGYCFNQATIQARQQRKRSVAEPGTNPLNVKERVERFYKTASETAFQLAGLMAAAPVSPPIIQLIQQTLLPESQQVHVAEVYMSGLLKSVTPAEAKLPPHQIQYDFLNEDVRDRLIDLTPIAQTEAVLDAVSRYISDRLGLQAKTYEALLLLDLERLPKTKQEGIEPFIGIAKRALRRLGGDYAALAAQIDSPKRPRPIPIPRPPRPEFPPLQTFEFDYPVISFEGTAEQAVDDEFKADLQTFEFETVIVNRQGQVIEEVQGIARYFVEVLQRQETPSVQSPVGVFVAYSYGDEELKSELDDHLSALSRIGLINLMGNTTVEAGEEWSLAMRDQLESSDILLVLLSARYLASSNADNREIVRTMERTKTSTARMIPVVLSPCNWQESSFRYLQVLPRDARPITEWDSRDEAFANVAQDLRRVAESIQQQRNAVSLEMVAIPGGSFMMGSPEDENGRYEDWEGPQHEVTVPAFFMSRYPITQAQWRAIAALEAIEQDLDPDPANFKGDDRPVEKVSWQDAMEFCARLSRLTGREYRLPTEAEWEYACRANTTTPFAFGETLIDKLANYAASEVFAEEPPGQYRRETTPVKTFPPNGFGLHDMHGNVWEWCLDHWHQNYGEGDGAPTDGSAWLFTEDEERDLNRVLRGGSWADGPRDCRSACRYYSNPDARNYVFYGFRVVCAVAWTP